MGDLIFLFKEPLSQAQEDKFISIWQAPYKQFRAMVSGQIRLERDESSDKIYHLRVGDKGLIAKALWGRLKATRTDEKFKNELCKELGIQPYELIINVVD